MGDMLSWYHSEYRGEGSYDNMWLLFFGLGLSAVITEPLHLLTISSLFSLQRSRATV